MADEAHPSTQLLDRPPSLLVSFILILPSLCRAFSISLMKSTWAVSPQIRELSWTIPISVVYRLNIFFHVVFVVWLFFPHWLLWASMVFFLFSWSSRFFYRLLCIVLSGRLFNNGFAAYCLLHLILLFFNTGNGNCCVFFFDQFWLCGFFGRRFGGIIMVFVVLTWSRLWIRIF